MNKRDFFIHSITSDLYLNRGWLESVFMILLEDSPSSHLHTHGAYLKDKKLYGDVHGKEELITGFVYGEPLYRSVEQITITAHELKCVKKDTITSYGIAVINAFLIERPYAGKVDFLNASSTKPIPPSTFDEMAKRALKSGGVVADRVREHKRYENGVIAITPLIECCLTLATEKSIVNNPQIAIEKRKLLKEHEGNLTDGAAIAEIQKKLEDIDRLYLKGDPSEYYNSIKKTRDARTRIHLMFGGEEDYYDPSKMILMENSLQEGIKLKDIPMVANSIREGSRRRAVSTANGGAEVKKTGRIISNYTIVGADCKSTSGVMRLLNEDNYKLYVGRYLVGSDKALTESDLHSRIGKTVVLRSPQRCLSPDYTVCPICIGDQITSTKLGLVALANTLTSVLMSIDMAAMHKAGLSTSRYNCINRIT